LLSKRSLRERFGIELAISMAGLLLVITVIFSLYFSYKLNKNIRNNMQYRLDFAKSHFYNQKDYEAETNTLLEKVLSHFEIKISKTNDPKINPLGFKPYTKNNQHYLSLTEYFPQSKKYYTISKDITDKYELISSLYLTMGILFLLSLLFIVYYTRLLSKKIMAPLETLTNQFTDMHESLLQPIETKELPLEFRKLSESVNLLITKVSTSIKYRKELYIGTAHELKTPLAVMRLKNQITLMKYKKHDNIRETLEQNISSIDTLNSMIHNLLEFGRAEGAQFEQPQRVNLIRLMATKCEEYEILAHSQNRDFIYHFNIPHFRINVQPLLFMQIFQNFIQNALKFTPKNGLVSLKTRMDTDNFIIEILDEGEGIDESKDLFAPFQRSLESTGAGLGLFLAQNAADSMGVEIDLQNRKDTKGAIASISFPLNRFLLKD
jgi:two-component system OmpR family sensor kinase